MANSGVVVVISGQDDTDKVFKAIETNLKGVSRQAHETESALGTLGERAIKGLEYFGIYASIEGLIDLLKDAAKESLEFGETIALASQKTGLSAGTLSTLHYAAALTNSDFDQLSIAVGRFDKMIGEAADGNKKAESFMGALGLNAKELSSNTDGAEIAFQKFAQTLASTESPVRRAQLAQELLGRAGSEMIPVLVEIGSNYDEFKKKAQEAGRFLDANTAEALERQAEKFRELQERVRGLEMAFMQGLLPGLDGVAKGFSSLGISVKDFDDAGKEVGKTLIVTASYLALLIKFLKQAQAEWDSWSSHINAMGDKIDATIGFTAGQRSSAAAHYKEDVKQSQDAVKEYKDAQAEYVNAQKGFREALDNYDHPAQTGKPKPKPGKGFGGAPDPGTASKLEAAQKALASARLRLDEQASQLRAEMAKQASEQALAQLDADHKKNLVSDEDFYKKKLALQLDSIERQKQAALEKMGEVGNSINALLADEATRGAHSAEGVEDEAKILDLRTKLLAITGEIAKLDEQAGKDAIDNATALDELERKRLATADELAAKHEALSSYSVAARLKQSADAYADKREGLVANYGAGSTEVANADAIQAEEQGSIRAKGADTLYSAQSAALAARKAGIQDQERLGILTTADARRQLIELDREEAQALQPVLEAYRQLAASGDLAATSKVVELQQKIAALENPVDEVSAHIRQSFDGAFESLFENLDEGTRDFQNFARSIEKALEQAAYKKFLEPLVQKGIASLIPGSRGYGDPGLAGVKPIQNPGADVGGSLAKSALGLGGALGIPGLSGFGKKAGGSTITIQLVNDSALPLKIGDTSSQGELDKDKVMTIIQDSFGEGGIMRSLLTGFHGGG